MSRQMTWLMKVGEKMMLFVLGHHGLVGLCLRKRVSTEVVRPYGRMEFATWSDDKLVKWCSIGLGRAQRVDGWSMYGGDGGNHGCNIR